MTIAHGNIGVLGYYTDLPLIDVLGLTDQEVAYHGIRMQTRAMAHDRCATAEYLERRHVNAFPISATRHPLPQGRVDKTYPVPQGTIARTWALRVADGVWFNVVSWDDQWIRENFDVTPGDAVPHGRVAGSDG